MHALDSMPSHYCGRYDDDDFTADIMCCACTQCGQYYPATNKIGKTCSWYSSLLSSGFAWGAEVAARTKYDDEDFTAEILCCAYNIATTTTTTTTYECTDASQYSGGPVGKDDTDCYYHSQWVPQKCGQDDDDDFTADIMCCACTQCGQYYPSTNKIGKTCSWYSWLSSTGAEELAFARTQYDDEDFTAEILCCAYNSE